MNSAIAFEPDSGQSGWQAILPERLATPQLTDDIEADYCVVGAGFAGLAAARRLHQIDPRASIVILEAVEVGTGPAGRNSGFMIDLPHVLSSNSYAGLAESDQRDIRLNRRSIEFARSAVSEYQLHEEAFRAEGKINAAASQSGVKANQIYAQHLEKLGEPYEMLDSQAIQGICGSDYYRGGLKTPGTAMIQPALLVRGIADGLSRSSQVCLYEKTPVQRYSKQGDRWKLSTSKGSVLAPKVLLAVNGFVENFGFYTRRLMHITLYASITRELSDSEVEYLGGQERWGFTPSDPFGTTVRKISDTGGHRLVIRNRISYDPSLTLVNNQLKQAEIDHRKAFEDRFPNLSAVTMQYRWSGRLCLSRNHVWALGKLDEGLYSACCQNGLGTTKGIVAGVVAAEMAAGVQDSLMPEFQSDDMPQKLLPEPFMTPGARSYLKFREWRAGRDK